MKIDFFGQSCNENLNDHRFGIIDPRPAETSRVDEGRWLITVENPQRKEIEFVAIDKCFQLRDAAGNEVSLCECLLRYQNNIDFVELKDRDKHWFEGGISQIISTVGIFVNYHDLKQFKRIRAFVGNKRRGQFNISNSAGKQILWKDYGVITFSKQVIEI